MQDWPLWGLFSSALLSASLLPGSSEITLTLLVHQAEYPITLLVFIATVGNTLGGVSSWLIGRFFSTSTKQNHRFIDAVQRSGSPLLLLSWLPLIGDPLCLAAGWCRTPFILSCFYIACGKLLRYVFLVMLIN